MLRITKYCILFALSTPAFSLGTGFYVGVGAGPDTGVFNQDAVLTQPGNAVVVDKQQHAAQGYFGSLFAGYSINFPAYYYGPRYLYLAGEINYAASSNKFQSFNREFLHINFSQTTFKMDQSYGFSILPGFLVTPTTLIYGRVGYANGNFKIQTSDVSLRNLNKYLDAFRYGMGLEQTVYPHVDVRVEYSQINYNSTSFATLDVKSVVRKNTIVTPKTNQFEFAIDYRFA